VSGPSRLALFTAASDAGSAEVIRCYSTSFGRAVRLLGPRVRDRVRAVYALVRLADEVVDGVAAEAGLDHAACAAELDALEAQTVVALRTGFSTNMVVHSFAVAARSAGIDESLTAPFFASMRRDLDTTTHSLDSHAEYVYGSAQVVGLMCLRIFLAGTHVDPRDRGRMESGALRLGSAFQNVNFLRDLADDTTRLGRRYLGDDGTWGIDETRKDAWVSAIRFDLAAAARTIPLLPRDCRAGVRCALRLFSALTDLLDDASVADLTSRRMRVPPLRKAVVLAGALVPTARAGR